jgi:hypothetical protein
MYELLMTFPEYIREYDLQRAEGLLLRYLSDVYRALAQTVPVAAKNDEVMAIEAYFGSIVRGVDSSLLDEWERLRTGESAPRAGVVAPVTAPQDSLGSPRAFRIRVINEVFMFIRSLALGDFATSERIVQQWCLPGSAVDGEGHVWSERRFDELSRRYSESGHTALRIDGVARASEHTRIEVVGDVWRIEQVLVDPDGLNDWAAEFELDLAATRTNPGQRLAMKLLSIQPIGS